MAHPPELSYNWRTPALFATLVALLRDGRATLLAWILAEAPQAELDASSRRTVEALQSKGLLP